jgi:hypothetical protein
MSDDSGEHFSSSAAQEAFPDMELIGLGRGAGVEPLAGGAAPTPPLP